MYRHSDPFGLGDVSADINPTWVRPQAAVGGYVDPFGNWHPTFCLSCHDPTNPNAKFYKDQAVLANMLDWKVIAYQQALGFGLSLGFDAIAEDLAMAAQMNTV